MHLPQALDKEPDRGMWGHTLHTYLPELYDTTPEDAIRIHDALWRVQTAATTTIEPPLQRDPNELRDVITELKPNKAFGPDGSPSQLFKYLTFSQIRKLAELLTRLLHDTDYNATTRPNAWNLVIAVMLPKTTQATELSKHRTISLMNQVQKAFSKWLTCLMAPTLDKQISEAQAGFRRG